jgi:GNAT superfamily N-acetyltransferase
VPINTLGLDIGALTKADIGAAFDLTTAAGENQSLADWAMLVRHGDVFGVHDARGQLIGVCATLSWLPRIGWVGVLVVSRPYRRRGIGTGLLRHAVERLRRHGLTPMLDLRAGALDVEALGFGPIARIERWQGRGRGPGAAALPTAEALQRAIEQDAAAFGGDREAMLLDLASRPDALTVTAGAAYLFCRAGRRSAQLGPVVGDTAAAATSILADAIDTIEGEITLCVPGTQDQVRDMLADRGFLITETFARMALGRAPSLTDDLRVTGGTDLG